MLTVDQFARVRRAYYQDKMSIREIARTFGHSRRKVRQVLQLAEPKLYPHRQSPAPKLDPVKPFIDAILTADETAPRKQWHTGPGCAPLVRRWRDELVPLRQAPTAERSCPRLSVPLVYF